MKGKKAALLNRKEKFFLEGNYSINFKTGITNYQQVKKCH